MNSKLAAIIKREKELKRGDEIVLDAMDAGLPLAEIIRGMRESGYAISWRIYVSGRKKRVPLSKLAGYFKRAREKKKTVRIQISFPQHDVPTHAVMAAVKREAALLER